MLNRSLKPNPAGEITFHLPELKKFKLQNGLEVLLVIRKNLPLLRVNLVVNTGSRLDPIGKKGLSNLFSLSVDEGAGELNSLELSDEFDMIGSNFDSSGSTDAIFLSLRTLKENYLRSVELFSNIITRPHLYPKDFEREKRKVLIRLLQQKDDPEEIAEIAFEKIIFGADNPYAYPSYGVEKDIQNITNEDITDYYANLFLPEISALIVVGDTDKEEIEPLLNNSLKNWKGKSKINIEIPPAQKSSQQVYLVHKENAVQSEIRIGCRTTKRKNEDYFAKILLNTILGGQFSSRINLNLREDKGYTYGAFSRFTYFKDDAYFYASTSVGMENTYNAIKEILFELKKIREGVTPEELEFAKSSTIRKFPSSFETNRQIAMNLTSKVIHNLPDDYFNTYIENIRGTDLQKVNNIAAESIHPAEMSILIVGDRNKLKDQLKKLNIGDFIEVDNEGEII